MNKLIFVVLTLSLLTSCAFHRGTISMIPLDKDVKYQDIAFGVSQYYKVLGFGGLSRDALIYEAKKEMLKNYPLSPNESYANYTLDFKKSFYLFFSQTKVTLTADIINYTDESIKEPFSTKFKDRIGKASENKSKLFEIGDTIIYNLNKKGLIISFVKEDVAKILYKTEKGKNNTKNISIFDIYTDKKDYKGNKIGGIHTFEESRREDRVTSVGKIIGIGERSILLEKENGELKIIKVN